MTALTLGFTIVFSYFPGLLGITASEKNAVSTEYAEKLFDKSSVTEIAVTVDPDAWEEMLENAAAEEYIACDVTIAGTTFTNVGIRPKGNTSLSQVASSDSDRYSFKFQFDEYIDGQTCFGLDKFVANNLISDATCMKEYLSYDLMASMGIDTPLYSFVNIIVNGETWGLYLAVEALEESFAERIYGSDYGNLYKVETVGNGGGERGQAEEEQDDRPQADGFPGQNGDAFEGALEEGGRTVKETQAALGGSRGGMGMDSGSGGDLVYTDDDPDSYSDIFSGTVFDKTGSADEERLIEALKTLNDGENLESCLDIDSTLRYIAANAALVNLDSYFGSLKHNYYLYEKDGVLTVLPWDYNLSFGGFQSGDASSAVNFPVDTPVSGTTMEARPLVNVLLSNESYLTQYHQILDEMLSSYFENGAFSAKVDALDALIGSYVENDPTAFYSYEEYCAAVEMLKTFGELRAQSIRGQLDGTIPSTDEGQTADPSSLVNASSVNLSVMGTQGGGQGGMGTDRTQAPAAQDDTEAGADAGEQNGVPGGQDIPQEGEMPSVPGNGSIGEPPDFQNGGSPPGLNGQDDGGNTSQEPQTADGRMNADGAFSPPEGMNGSGAWEADGFLTTGLLIIVSILLLSGAIWFVCRYQRRKNK